MRKLLLSICLWVGCLITPQETKAQVIIKNVPTIDEQDAANVYSAFSYMFLTSERLADQNSTPLQKEDMEKLNLVFKGTKPLHRSSYPNFIQKGIFIDIKNDKDERSGYYISSKQYTFIDENNFGHNNYYIPRKLRPQIKELIERYQQKLPDSIAIMQHDYQKMSIETRPLNLCMFNPNKKMVMLTFYTCVDSLTVLPIEYRIFKHKKKGIQVWRDVSLWDHRPYCGTDEKGNLCIQNSEGIIPLKDQQDSLAVEILCQSFPTWKEMNNAERMQTLDSYFERYASLIYQKTKKKRE